MATLKRFFVLLITSFMSSVIPVCLARSTFDGQENQFLWPYVYDDQVSKHDPAVGAKPLFYPRTAVEPSSRDLDIGFTVGERDDVEMSPNLNSYKTVEPIKSGYVANEGYRDQRTDDFKIGVFTDRPSLRYPSSGGHVGDRVSFVPGVEPVQWRRSPRVDGMRQAYIQRADRVPLTVVPQNLMLDDEGYPGVIMQPLGNKVGEFKLRNDQGYQLSMHVPPSSVGDRPGVLKIDMKATLYRPIYY